jgi:hypothetical protein
LCAEYTVRQSLSLVAIFGSVVTSSDIAFSIFNIVPTKSPPQVKVIVYDFTHEDYTIYGFDSVIPVAIWDGRCQIDFRKLYDQIRFIYEREE